MKGESSLRGSLRLVQLAEKRERSSEPKMREGPISVGFDTAKEPIDRFEVCCELQLGSADIHQPPEGEDIARRKAQSFVDMGLGLCATTHNKLVDTDERVRISQIAIQRHSSLDLAYASHHAVCIY